MPNSVPKPISEKSRTAPGRSTAYCWTSGCQQIALELLYGDVKQGYPQRELRTDREGEQDGGNGAIIGPANGMNSSTPARRPSVRADGIPSDPEAEAGQQSDDDHGDRLPLEPEPKRALGFEHRLRRNASAARRDQLDRADAIEVGLRRQIDSGEDHDQQVRECRCRSTARSGRSRQAAAARARDGLPPAGPAAR